MTTSERPAPYVIGKWVRGDAFYGRRPLLEEILGGSRDALWVVGGRRVGKTSLLKELERQTTLQDLGYFPLFWDLQGAFDPAELGLDFRDALLDAEERLSRTGIELRSLPEDDPFAALAQLRRQLTARRRKLLLLCDETEALLGLQRQDPTVLPRLRRALQSADGIRTVLTSSVLLWELAEERGATSPFLLGFTPPLYLGPLSAGASRALLRQEHLPEALRPDLDDRDVEEICRRCGDHPYLCQLLGKRYLEVEDLERACAEVAADRTVSYFFSVDFEMLSATERCVLHGLAGRSSRHTDGVGSVPGDGDLVRLEKLGFLRRAPAGRWSIGNDFLKRWLERTPPPLADAAGTTTAATLVAGRGEPRTIGERYQLLERVGTGASGVVYRARDTLLDIQVALKLLAGGPGFDFDRSRREILLARDLSHPHILKVYDLGYADEKAYLTAQWVEGTTLERRLAEDGRLGWRDAVIIARKLASALAAAHGRRILHRDVKPGNILLDRSGEPLLADFGLARRLDGPAITVQPVFQGTPAYASPEQASLEPLDEASDVYSLGVVLYEMCTGAPPFCATSVAELLEMQRTAEPLDPRALAPDLPPALALLIRRCLEKDVSRRLPAASALEAELDSLLGDSLSEHA